MGRLEHHRVAELRRELLGLFSADDGSGTAGQNRHLRAVGDFAGRRFVAKLIEQLGSRADEDQPRLVTRPPQCRILGEKAVTGVDGVDPVGDRRGDDPVDIQIRPNRLPFLADAIRLVGLEAVQGVPIFMRIDRDRADAQLMGRAKHADRNFAAIGDEQFADSFYHVGRAYSNRTEQRKYVTLAPQTR